MEKSQRHALTLHLAHGAGVVVGQDAFGIAPPHLGQLISDDGIGVIPADRCKLAFAFFADAPERRFQPVRVVATFGVAADLGAQRAGGQGMRRVAFDGGYPSAFNAHPHGAGIGAIVRAGSLNFTIDRRSLRPCT